MKKPWYKKWWIWLIVIVVAFFALGSMGANSSSNKQIPSKLSVKYGDHTIYKTNVTSIKGDGAGDWIIKGTTKAPNGTKIIAVSTTNSDTDNAASTSNIDKWSKAKNGKFKIYVDSVTVTKYQKKYTAGQKSKVAIFGITKYDKDTDDHVSKKIISAYKNKFSATTLTLTTDQANYINGLIDDSSSSSSSNSDSSISSSESAETSSTNATSGNTTSQEKAALESAETYATMSMSKQAIYDQLISNSGDGFTPSEAQYAVDNLTNVDWNENALESAETYQNEMSMSTSEIRDQLTSSSGDQFTPEQANYAIQHLNN